MSGGREIDKAIEKLESEIRMLKLRVRELADEQPATVAPDADLHPVALKLAEAYRLARDYDDTPFGVLTHIREAWCRITGESPYQKADIILTYGVRS